MTTETMREAVKRAIYAKLEVSAFLPYEELADAEFAACISEEDVSHEFLDSIASDVIRTVLERLREPSEAMWTAGRDPILARDGRMPASMLVEQSWYEPERDCAGRKDGYVTKGDCAVWVWRAMLDAAVREVG